MVLGVWHWLQLRGCIGCSFVKRGAMFQCIPRGGWKEGRSNSPPQDQTLCQLGGRGSYFCKQSRLVRIIRINVVLQMLIRLLSRKSRSSQEWSTLPEMVLPIINGRAESQLSRHYEGRITVQSYCGEDSGKVWLNFAAK